MISGEVGSHFAPCDKETLTAGSGAPCPKYQAMDNRCGPVSIRKPHEGGLTWNLGAKTGDRAELEDPGASSWQ